MEAGLGGRLCGIRSAGMEQQFSPLVPGAIIIIVTTAVISTAPYFTDKVASAHRT